MSAVTSPIPNTVLDPIMDQYDVGKVTRCWPASHGIENQNYFVETQGPDRSHSFVLTIMLSPSYAGDAYIPMMRSLDEQGLPVAPPLANRKGEAITVAHEKYCLLQPRLPGQHTINPTLKQIEGLARFMGRMHRASHNTDLSLPSYPRDPDWIRNQITVLDGFTAYADKVLLNDTLTQVTSLLSRTDTQALSRGLIHGDLFRDNVLFNEHGLTGVLDFHHAAHGFFIYDLAVAANDWCNDATGLLDSDRTTSLLRAYHQVRPLDTAELWFFPLFAAYAALVFWLSRAVRQAESAQDPTVRTKDPEEFKRILCHLHKRTFYLDHRQLGL